MINFYNLCLNYSSVNISHFQCKSIGKFWRVSYSLMEQKIAVMDVSTDFFFHQRISMKRYSVMNFEQINIVS